MAADAREELTSLLDMVRQGDPAAKEQVAEKIYGPLHRVAKRLMEKERADHTLTPTALLHEGLLRLLRTGGVESAPNGTYLLGAAVEAMRRVLIDHQRGRGTDKRGGSLSRQPLSSDLEDLGLADSVEFEEDLRALAEAHERASQVVTLRFFGGLTVAETAQELGVSEATVEGDWRFARAWLRRRLDQQNS